jgi:hypothetical protein
MAQTFPEAEAIEEARKRNGVVIFVGYMRRFAPALALLKAEIEGKQIRYVRVRDIIGKASARYTMPIRCVFSEGYLRTPSSPLRPACSSSTFTTFPLVHLPNWLSAKEPMPKKCLPAEA